MEEEGDRSQTGRDGCVASETSNGREGARERERDSSNRLEKNR